MAPARKKMTLRQKKFPSPFKLSKMVPELAESSYSLSASFADSAKKGLYSLGVQTKKSIKKKNTSKHTELKTTKSPKISEDLTPTQTKSYQYPISSTNSKTTSTDTQNPSTSSTTLTHARRVSRNSEKRSEHLRLLSTKERSMKGLMPLNPSKNNSLIYRLWSTGTLT